MSVRRWHGDKGSGPRVLFVGGEAAAELPDLARTSSKSLLAGATSLASRF